MAYDVITKAHPELQEALEFAVRAVAAEGVRCRSPVRVCAEKLLEFDRKIDIHRHSRQSRSDQASSSRNSRSASRAEEAEQRCGFVHVSREDGGGDTDNVATVDQISPELTTAASGQGSGRGSTRMSLLFKASSPAALSSIAEGDAGGEADADGGGNSSPQQAQKQQQRGSTGNRSSTSSAADEAEEHSRRQRAHAGRGRRQVVFSEPVRLDAEWHPVLVPKSQQQREEIAGVMRQNILFAGIDDDASRVIIDAMEPRDFSKGDVIIQQGDKGDFYYVLSEGTCDITVDGRQVLQARKGMGFGELALLYDAPRAASVTVTSVDGARTWALDRVTFKQVLIGTTIRKREMYEAFLRGVPIFATLTHAEILTIADALQPAHFTAGEEVVREGDRQADRFYIVEDGELKAEIRGVPGEVCDRMKRGCYFGERALITDEPRAATVTAVKDSKCLAMDRAAFIRLLGPITEILARNMEVYAQYIAQARTPTRPAPA